MSITTPSQDFRLEKGRTVWVHKTAFGFSACKGEEWIETTLAASSECSKAVYLNHPHYKWAYRYDISLTNPYPPDPMNAKEKAKYRQDNQKYLGLTDAQCDMHCDILQMQMGEWPESLRHFCGEQSRLYGFSGDALSCWVAEWLKAGNVIEDPFAGESDEDYEKGRIEAIKLLGGTVDVPKKTFTVDHQ